jgi:hypothetical protein
VEGVTKRLVPNKMGSPFVECDFNLMQSVKKGTTVASIPYQDVIGNDGSVSCQDYCEGVYGKPWNGELPMSWNGAVCIGTPTDPNIGCNKVTGKPVVCRCQRSGQGWYKGGPNIAPPPAAAPVIPEAPPAPGAAPAPAPRKPGCEWNELKNMSIDSLQCPPGSSGSWGKDRCNVPDISIAKANCENDPGCTGITSQVNAANGGSDIAGWEPRNNRNGYRPWPGVTSYECKRS